MRATRRWPSCVGDRSSPANDWTAASTSCSASGTPPTAGHTTLCSSRFPFRASPHCRSSTRRSARTTARNDKQPRVRGERLQRGQLRRPLHTEPPHAEPGPTTDSPYRALLADQQESQPHRADRRIPLGDDTEAGRPCSSRSDPARSNYAVCSYAALLVQNREAAHRLAPISDIWS
jgi:hypothetical protein